VPRPLPERLRLQAEECARFGSPLYAELLAACADDAEAGGVVAAVVAGHERRPVVGLRLLGAVHRLVLEGRAPALAAYYPSVGGSGPPAGAWPALRATLAERGAEVAGLLDRTVQTNEVGRSAALYGGLLAAGGELPVRLLEVGASAGLNLLVDRYAYVVGGRALGDPGSPLRLVEPWRGSPVPDPTAPLRVAERAGCDPDPVDPARREGRLTLAAYVWADQVERLRRLRAALRVAAAAPAPVERRAGADWLEAVLRRPAPGRLTVVWHSVVWPYLAAAERARVEAALAAAGERATPAAPLAHLAYESRKVEGRFRFEVRLTSWPGGGDQLSGAPLRGSPDPSKLLAIAEGHGPPVRWLPT
jgi:hypothetical protein